MTVIQAELMQRASGMQKVGGWWCWAPCQWRRSSWQRARLLSLGANEQCGCLVEGSRRLMFGWPPTVAAGRSTDVHSTSRAGADLGSCNCACACCLPCFKLGPRPLASTDERSGVVHGLISQQLGC